MRYRWLDMAATVLVAAVCASSAYAQSRQVRIGLIAGNNLGHDSNHKLRYAEAEVTRLSELLRTSGDFDTVVTLRGANRRDIENSLLQVRRKLETAKTEGNQTLFLFYYSGHGDNEALELGSERFPLRDLRGYLEQLTSADVRVAFVDACQSGALTGVKGGRRAPGFEVRLADPGQVKGMAIVTSSTANEFSQESDELQGSFFSHSIMSGLRGAADTSRDGQVTLSEVYQFAFKRTLASTAASLVGGQHPTYDYRMAGAGEVVLTRIRPKDARLAFVREQGSTYTVFNKRRGEVVAELPSSPSEDLYLAVPAGEYRIVRRMLGDVKEQNLALASDSSTTVEPSAMTEVVQASRRKKGGGDELRNALGVYAGFGTATVPGSANYLGVLALSYARDISFFTLRGRLQASKYDTADAFGLVSNLVRMGGWLDFLVPLVEGEYVSLLLGPSVGAPIARERSFDNRISMSYGVSYGGALALALRLYGNTSLAVNLDGGGETYRLDGVRTHRATASLLIGGVVSF